jgi:hypothetical protein
MKKPTPNIIQCMEDSNLLGQFVKTQATIRRQKVYLKGFYALPPGPGDLEILKHHTSLTKWPEKPYRESTLISGARGRKTETAADIITFEAALRVPPHSAGEKVRYINVSPTRKQSAICKGYVSARFNENDFFSGLLSRETSEELELINGAVISILSSDYKTLQGFTAAGAVIDEAAYMDVEGARPLIEVIRTLRARLISTNGWLIKITTPWGKTGPIYNDFKKYWGADGAPVLVWRGTSLEMNPTLKPELVEQALQDDYEGAKNLYLAEFRSDIETYARREIVESCVIPSRFELPPIQGVRYVAFCDPAGGSGKDSMTLAVAHRENETLILDCLREVRPPFSPDQTVKDFAQTLKRYALSSVVGDRYGGEWPREKFREQGFEYRVSEKSKSDLYREMLPLLNSGEVELLDNDKLVSQICGLERRVARGGRDSIDHGPGGRDDLANVTGGVLTLLAGKKEVGPILCGFLDGDLNFESAALKEQATQQDQTATTGQQTGPRRPNRSKPELKFDDF